VECDRSGPRLKQTGTLLYSGDPGMNCLFRWDWQALHLTDPDLFPEESHRLAQRAQTMRAMWGPFLG
jgi:hypothetical protein